VTHPGNVKMPFALTVQILLAQISVSAFEDSREEPEFVVFTEGGHVD